MTEEHFQFIEELREHFFSINGVNIIYALRKLFRCLALAIEFLTWNECIKTLHPLHFNQSFLLHPLLNFSTGVLTAFHLYQIFSELLQISLKLLNLLH